MRQKVLRVVREQAKRAYKHRKLCYAVVEKALEFHYWHVISIKKSKRAVFDFSKLLKACAALEKFETEDSR